MRESIVVVVEFHIQPDQVDRWLSLALEHLQNCVAEQGMLRFWVHRDDQDPAHFLFYEEWADRADLDHSLEAPWRHAYLTDTEGLWETPRAMTIYRRVETLWEPLDATGLPTSRPAAVADNAPGDAGGPLGPPPHTVTDFSPTDVLPGGGVGAWPESSS